MARFNLTPRARRDLEDIWNYSVDRWGIDRAEAYLRSIQSAMSQLAANPSYGSACDEIRRGYRKHPVQSHVIFNLEAADGIDVIRILHQRMDLNARL